MEKEDTTNPDLDTVCQILDKLTIRQLQLMEEKMLCELSIESSINNGSIHLAKTRYIMGQTFVSTARLPTEASAEFSASTLCETSEDDDIKKVKLVENSAKNVVNPLRWFGVLVPQNMHKAQNIFLNALNFVVECVNVQLQLHENSKYIGMLKAYKSTLQST